MAQLYYTQQYERDLLRVYKTSLRNFGYRTARETMRQIEDVENKLRQDRPVGKIDAVHHSHRFQFVSIRNSQKIFFERDGDSVYMVTVGYARRDWKHLLADLEDYADQHIKRAQQRKD